MDYQLSQTDGDQRDSLRRETPTDYYSELRKSEPPRMDFPLTQLNFYITEGCNLSCRHCWVPAHPSNNGKGHRFLPVEIFRQVVEEALPLGLRAVRISGAYPLLHPDLYTMLDLTERMELSLVIEANGAGMTPELARRLARIPQVTASVGLDGVDAVTHDSLHGTPGGFAAAVSALRALAHAGLAPEIVFTLLRRNAGQVAALIGLAQELGAGAIRLSIPQQQNGAWIGDELRVEELIALGRRVERQMAFTTRIRLVFDQPPAFRGLHPQARIEGQGRCGVLNMLSVLPSGAYTLCGLSQPAAEGGTPELVFGQAGTDPLEQVWKQQPAILMLRSGMPEKLEGVCDRCAMKSACLGNCAVENYLRTGSFWSPHWFCEAAEQAGLFPASRLTENLW